MLCNTRKLQRRLFSGRPFLGNFPPPRTLRCGPGSRGAGGTRRPPVTVKRPLWPSRLESALTARPALPRGPEPAPGSERPGAKAGAAFACGKESRACSLDSCALSHVGPLPPWRRDGSLSLCSLWEADLVHPRCWAACVAPTGQVCVRVRTGIRASEPARPVSRDTAVATHEKGSCTNFSAISPHSSLSLWSSSCLPHSPSPFLPC